MSPKIDAPCSLRRSSALVLGVRDEAQRGRLIRWHPSRDAGPKSRLWPGRKQAESLPHFARWMAGFNPTGIFFSSVSRLHLGKGVPRGEKSFSHRLGPT